MTGSFPTALRTSRVATLPGPMANHAPAATGMGPAGLVDADEPAYKRVLGGLVLYLALGIAGISWYPLINKVSFDNVGAVAVLFLAPLAWRRGARPALVFVLLFLVVAYLAGTLLVRSDATVTFMLRPIVYTLAGCALSMVVYPRRPGLIVGAGMLTYLLMFAFSAYTAQVDVVQAVLRGIVNLDRGYFKSAVIKATLNAFSEGDTEFATSHVNTLSAFLIMSFAYMAARRRYILAILAAGMIFVLFSSSGMLSLALLLLLIVTGAIKTRAGLFRALIIALLLTSSLAYFWSDITDYIEVNIDADTQSRQSRINQYSRAIDQINENPIFGSGELRGDFNFIHNLVFFAWSNSGIIPMLLLIAIYAIVGLMLFVSVKNFYTRSHEWLIVPGLLITFLARTLVGGGGGLPVPSSAFALGLAILEFRRLAMVTPQAKVVSLAAPRQALIRTS